MAKIKPRSHLLDGEPLVAQIQEIRDSPMPDSQRLQALLHLTSELARMTYSLSRRTRFVPERKEAP